MNEQKSVQEEFLTACRKGDLAAAKRLLSKGADVNKAVQDPIRPHLPPKIPLKEAVASRKIDLVSFLIEKGASLSGEAGANALKLARSAEMARLLVTKGVPINVPGRDGYSPLASAISGGSVKEFLWLLDLGADINVLTFSETPLHQAARLSGPGAKLIIETLLRRGASLEAKSDDGSTALIVAAKNGRFQMAKLLLQMGANPRVKDKSGKTAADYAETPEFKNFLEKWDPKSSSTAVAAESLVQVPKRLAAFFQNREAEKYKGFHISGLPLHTRDTRLKVTFVGEKFDLFDENGINRETHPQWMPLCRLGGGEDPEFLAVKLTNPKCPVAMWLHEDGKFYPVAVSLDKFLQRLSPKR